jgi:hypothetical protein
MILVDTSVWISYFRGTDRQLSARMHGLLDEDQIALAIPVKIEILGGSPSRESARLRSVLEALPVFYPSRHTWELMEGWIERAVDRGERFGVADLLIAALAAERGALLWSLDREFARMQKLRFVRLYRPS